MVTKIFMAAVFGLAFLAVGPVAISSAQNGNSDHKVTICHRTNSAKNPYVQITVAHRAVDGEGQNDHSHHTGTVFNPAVHNQQNRGWGDIIPPVDGVTDGLNWNAKGQAIYNNGCKPVTEGGNGGVTPPPAPPQVLGGAQVEAPAGAVKAGVGGNSSAAIATLGLGGSLAALGYGIYRLRRTE